MSLELKPDERILAYGIASLVLAIVFGPFGLFLGLRTRSLARYAAVGYRSAPPDEFDPQLARIGNGLAVAGIVVGAVYTALAFALLIFHIAAAIVSALPLLR